MSKSLQKRIQVRFPKLKVLVVGDAMLDEYWFGDSTRISPEAPVPITKIAHKDQHLGGAANVAANAASLGGKVTLLSIIGEDEAGQILQTMLEKARIESYLIETPAIHTTLKLRIIARNQQLLRIDLEDAVPGNYAAQLVEQFNILVQAHDVVVFSDYDKGSLQKIAELLSLAKEVGCPTVIDPKGNNYTPYYGADFLTPNRSELFAVIGEPKSEAELTEKAQALRKKLSLAHLLLTRSEEGLSLYSDRGSYHQETIAKEVYDVSGAGDTVLAATALSLGIGLNGQDLMKVANAAAGVVVGKLGTATCSLKELIKEL